MSQVTAPLVGSYFRPPAKAILQHLPSGCSLSIVPEPDNPYDANALAVFVASASIPASERPELDAAGRLFGFPIEDILAREAWQLGYVKATEAVGLQPRVVAALQGQPVYPATLAFDMKGLPVVVLEFPE